jgi:hypothetical protein
VPVLHFVPLPAGCLRSQPRRSSAPQFATISARSISINTFTAAIVRTSRSIRRAATNLITRFTRKASINLAITISLPPFVKLAIDYKADLSKPENRLPKPANDNKPRRSRKRTA